jgi:hypothetical protein
VQPEARIVGSSRGGRPASVGPKSTNRWKDRGAIRVMRVWCSQRHPLLTLYTRCAKAGTRTPFGRCRDDGGKRDEPDRVFPHSFVSLSPWTWPLSRSSGDTGSSRPTRCFSKLSLYYESCNSSALAITNADPPRYLTSFIGIATTIRNDTDELGRPTA